jgi:Luciferase-like monooxygenase
VLALLGHLFAGGSAPYQGRRFSYERGVFAPIPDGRVPIMVGGNSDAALRRAARYGDVWQGIPSSPTAFCRQARTLAELARGREVVAALRIRWDGTLPVERVVDEVIAYVEAGAARLAIHSASTAALTAGWWRLPGDSQVGDQSSGTSSSAASSHFAPVGAARSGLKLVLGASGNPSAFGQRRTAPTDLNRKQSAMGSQSQSDCQDALIPKVPTELVEYASVICWATVAASSPTPISNEDFRFRMKWTPTNYSPGTTVLAPSWASGNPQVSKASGQGSHVR